MNKCQSVFRILTAFLTVTVGVALASIGPARDDAIRSAAAVITDSEASRRDIIRVLDVPGERISVIPLAVSRDVEPMSPAPGWRNRRAAYQRQ